jgi:hypothetical protein
MSDDYRIEKVRHRVGVTLASGDYLEGDIFLQAFARFHAGHEQPLDFLNESEPFLPLELPTSELLLVNKSHIAFVATELPETDYASGTGIVGMDVEITFGFGDAKRGAVFPELRADRSRLIDFFNATHVHFLPLYTTDQLLIFGVAHVAYARPIS